MIAFVPFVLSLWTRISLAPTRPNPRITKYIPVHSRAPNLRSKKPMDKIPVKMITEPRSIWKLLAKVKFNPTYIIEVAVISHIAGIKSINGLNSLEPFVKALLSTDPSWNRNSKIVIITHLMMEYCTLHSSNTNLFSVKIKKYYFEDQ